MKDFFKSFWKKINEPKPSFLCFFYVFTALAIVGALLMLGIGFEKSPISIIAYVLFGISALSLSYTVYTLVLSYHDIKASVVGLVRKCAFLDKLIEEYSFRTLVFASLSFVINLAYVVFHIVISAISGSLWYGALAAYYVLLTVMRGGIVLYHRQTNKGALRDEETELRRYKITGVLLVLMPICLSAAIAEMVISNKGYRYAGFIIYAVAAYSFYKITMAVINVIKAKQSYGITIEAVRNIGLADALVSLLALQTAMFNSFADAEFNSSVPNALTGAAVCAFTVTIGVAMLRNSRKYKRKLENEQGKE